MLMEMIQKWSNGLKISYQQPDNSCLLWSAHVILKTKGCLSLTMKHPVLAVFYDDTFLFSFNNDRHAKEHKWNDWVNTDNTNWMTVRLWLELCCYATPQNRNLPTSQWEWPHTLRFYLLSVKTNWPRLERIRSNLFWLVVTAKSKL